MKTSQAGIDLICAFEGFSPTPYLCPAKVWTIGFGSTAGVTQHTPAISRDEAMALLRLELGKYETSVRRLITAPLNQNQFDALVSFTYNLGTGALQRSTLRAKLNRGEYEAAASELMRWVSAGGKKLPGLVRRRGAERELFLSAIPEPAREQASFWGELARTISALRVA